jgi:aspartate aminotransferase
LEYAPISGIPAFVDLATDLLYGHTKASMKDRLVSTQALSGTGALRLGMDVLCALRCGEDQDGDNRRVYLPAETWGNHVSVVSAARLLPLTYPYTTLGTKVGIDSEAMLRALDAAPRGSVVLLHACAHNPTGLDPDVALWSQISDIVLKRGLVPFFDVAYQGVASGSCEKDVEGLRLFVERGHTLLAAQSFAKNFGVYGERAGVLSIVTASPSEAAALRSQVQRIVRAAYSSPPIHGARLVSEVLGDSTLRSQWERDLQSMVGRLNAMRQGLVTALEEKHNDALALGVADQQGMFAFLPGLRPELIDRLRSDYHVYMTRDGRMSLSGLNPTNLQYVADSICSVAAKC